MGSGRVVSRDCQKSVEIQLGRCVCVPLAVLFLNRKHWSISLRFCRHSYETDQSAEDVFFETWDTLPILTGDKRQSPVAHAVGAQAGLETTFERPWGCEALVLLESAVELLVSLPGRQVFLGCLHGLDNICRAFDGGDFFTRGRAQDKRVRRCAIEFHQRRIAGHCRQLRLDDPAGADDEGLHRLAFDAPV